MDTVFWQANTVMKLVLNYQIRNQSHLFNDLPHEAPDRENKISDSPGII